MTTALASVPVTRIAPAPSERTSPVSTRPSTSLDSHGVITP
jgi:hypothetical protein